MTDPISDMLTRIRNALAVKKAEVVLPYSKLKQNLAELLHNQGWIDQVEIDGGTEEKSLKHLKLKLKYDEAGSPIISGLNRISKPGQRIYARSQEIPKVKSGFGATIVSTSKGLMTDRQARKEKVGGEVICQIW
ncbi:MAG: 30S ribosomal protein S8 [Candidatus Doudnabacteria bacterium]|nr:30S ribosomal protein S8 [bacterium]MDZ4244132.1 30S ribosomal protein S8 [Candidatus Doudnabacteria bacterium]